MTKQEIENWKQHPGTKELVKALVERKQDLQNAWSAGQFTGRTADETAQMNASAIGKVQQLEGILESIEEIGDE